MLVIKKQKPRLSEIADKVRDLSPEPENKPMGRGLLLNPQDIAGAVKEQTDAAGNRAPEFFVLAKNPKVTVRFRKSVPLAAFYAYQARYNGKFVRLIVDPENDILGEALGPKFARRLFSVWGLYDVSGYTDQQGKAHVWRPRFWVVGTRIHNSLIALAKDLKEEGSALSKRNIKVTRTGVEKNTSYTFRVLDAEASVKPQSVLDYEAKEEFIKPEEHYTALTITEQRTWIHRLVGATGEED